MKHIKQYKIFESSDILYKEVHRIDAMNLALKDATNISNQSINKICKLLDNEFYYIKFSSRECNMRLDDEKVVRYFRMTLTEFEVVIDITEMDDCYYYVSIREGGVGDNYGYYICDTLQGVLQLLQITLKGIV